MKKKKLLHPELVKLLAKEICKNLKGEIQIAYQNSEDVFLTIDELSDLINMTKGSIYGLVHKNSIPFHKKGKLYFLKSEIIAWLKSGKSETKSSLHEKADEYLLKNSF